MSRIVHLGIKIAVSDISILRTTCERLGFLLVDGPTKFNWHGGEANCDMRIDVPGVRYQVGLILANNQNYEIQFDSYGGLGNKIGVDGGILLQEFGADKLDYHAQVRGWMVEKEYVDNRIHLTLRG